MSRSTRDRPMAENAKWCPGCDKFADCELFPNRVEECIWVNDAIHVTFAIWGDMSGYHHNVECIRLPEVPK